MISVRCLRKTLVPKRSPKDGNVIQDWNSRFCFLVLIADETPKQHGLAVRHRTVEWRRRCEIVGVKVG